MLLMARCGWISVSNFLPRKLDLDGFPPNDGSCGRCNFGRWCSHKSWKNTLIGGGNDFTLTLQHFQTMAVFIHLCATETSFVCNLYKNFFVTWTNKAYSTDKYIWSPVVQLSPLCSKVPNPHFKSVGESALCRPGQVAAVRRGKDQGIANLGKIKLEVF